MTILDMSPCIRDEARFHDPETREWGYVVVCENSEHWHMHYELWEMFRRPDQPEEA